MKERIQLAATVNTDCLYTSRYFAKRPWVEGRLCFVGPPQLQSQRLHDWLKDENNHYLNHLPQGRDRYLFFWIVGHWPIFKYEQNVFPNSWPC